MAISRALLSLSVGILCCISSWAQQYVITTFAGNGTAGSTGDGSAAASAQLSSPAGMALDSSGKLYIADAANHRVRVVSNGTITTFAGTGTAGFAGDGKAASSAQLSSPSGVAVDSSGNVYIADTGNNVVRMVASSGNITTFAGNNSNGAGYAGDTGLATAALLNSPLAVAADSSGNVYIADAGNNVIRKVSPATASAAGTISTVVGGAATYLQLFHPDALALDASGALYIADAPNRRIVKFSAGYAAAFAGTGSTAYTGDNGPAIQAGLADPAGVATDSAGNVYIADTIHSRIRKVSPGGIITTIAGTGRFTYSGDGGPALSAGLNFPHAVIVDKAGNVYVSDSANNVIRLLTPQTPAISANGVVNAASFAAQISPGALATVFGSNLGGANAGATVPLPTSLGGVSVTVNGKAAPILFVAPGQVNFQVPWETVVGPGAVVVNNGVNSNTVTVPVLTAAPGLFTFASGQAVVQNSDFTLNGPGNPIKAGGTIIAYLTGSGPVSPAVANGAAAPSGPLAQVTSPFSATIGTSAGQVSFAGLTPGFVGLLQMNIVVPSGLASGDYPLTVTIHSETSNSGKISVSK
jgi:uncharacterized protein (TIGR03437 family)